MHGDLYGTVLFAGTAAPGITDITPYWRPASWAAGVVVVDALSWGEADDGLIDRWSALPEWPQMLLRALMFRLAVHALHPRATASAFPGLARTAALVRLVAVRCWWSEPVAKLAPRRTRPSSASTPSARSNSSCRVARCAAGRPDAEITRCHGRSEESVRMIQPTMRGLESPAAEAISPYVATRPDGMAATSPRTRST